MGDGDVGGGECFWIEMYGYVYTCWDWIENLDIISARRGV